MKSKQELKKVFENGDKPKQEDFWEWQDSYWHKEDSIPIEKIEELENSLDSKANVDSTNVTNTEAWRYALNLYSKSEIDDELSQIETEIVTERNINTNQDEIIQNLETTINELNSWKSQLTDVDTDNIVNTLTELLATFQSIPEGTDIYELINSKINTSDIVNNLTSLSTTKVLSANQGKVLKDLIDSLSTAQQNISFQSVLNAGSEALLHYGTQKFSLTSESPRALTFNKSEDEVFELISDSENTFSVNNTELKYSGAGDNVSFTVPNNGLISLKSFNNSQLIVDPGGSKLQTGDSYFTVNSSDVLSYGNATNTTIAKSVVELGVGGNINPNAYNTSTADAYLRMAIGGHTELKSTNAMDVVYRYVFSLKSISSTGNIKYALWAHDNGLVRLPNNTYDNIVSTEGYEPHSELAATVDYVDRKVNNIQIGGLIEITYDELVNLKNTSSLVKGQNYLLTDYMTTYEQPMTGLIKSSGIVEPLIITAIDVDKLHNQCKSTLYPQDIVFYEITGDIGDYYGTEGFTKGKIYRRIDTLRNNDIGTDWRHVKYDRDGVDKLLFENYNDCYNNVIKTYHLFSNVVGNDFHSNTIGNDFFNNTIGNNFHSNTIGNNFFNNTIRDAFHSNTIGNDFFNNTIRDDFYFNTIGDFFRSNTIGNNFRSNTIGNAFYSNTIGNDFYSNTIGNDFRNSGTQTTPLLSKNTEFKNNVSGVISTTEIQNENINVVVFSSPNGTLKQRYYDDSNNLVINNL